MKMKNPVHPGLLVMECLEGLGMGVAEAALGMGVTRQQLYNVMAGRSGVSPEMALRLEKALGSTAETWLSMQANHDLARARLRRLDAGISRLEPKPDKSARS